MENVSKPETVLIKHLGLSTRARTPLVSFFGWEGKASEVAHLSEADLLRFRNIGRKTIREIREALAEHGLKLSSQDYLTPAGKPIAQHLINIETPTLDQIRAAIKPLEWKQEKGSVGFFAEQGTGRYWINIGAGGCKYQFPEDKVRYLKVDGEAIKSLCQAHHIQKVLNAF